MTRKGLNLDSRSAAWGERGVAVRKTHGRGTLPVSGPRGRLVRSVR